MVRVSTACLSSYQSVNRCVVCGNPTTTALLPVHGSSNSYKRIDTITVQFPICNACDEAIHSSEALIKPFRRWGWLSFLAFILVFILLSVFANQQSYYGALIVVDLLVWMAIMIMLGVLRSIAKRNNKESWDLSKKVRRSVSILSFTRPSLFNGSGKVVFRFEDDAYGREFAQLNMGKVLEKLFS